MSRLTLAAMGMLAMGLAAGCVQKPAEAPAVDVAAEAEAIKALSVEWAALWNNRDATGIVDRFMAEDAYGNFDGKVLQGSAAMLANMQDEFTQMPDSTLSWETAKVQVASSGDLAYERGSWTFDPDGAGDVPAANGEYLTVWSKADGSWRVVADAGSTTKAAAE